MTKRRIGFSDLNEPLPSASDAKIVLVAPPKSGDCLTVGNTTIKFESGRALIAAWALYTRQKGWLGMKARRRAKKL